MSELSGRARRHLWLHFSRMGAYSEREIPVMVRGEGAYVWDSRGKRYLDGLSSLFTTQLGHGRTELAEAAAKQSAQLAYFPVWGYAHPAAIDLAEALAERTPGDLNRVFFTTGGSEAVETAWKLARQYFALIGQPQRQKVISRDVAYHGVTLGALSITGTTTSRAAWEPLSPLAVKVPVVNTFRPQAHEDDMAAYSSWSADQIETRIIAEGPETVAAVFLEPVQNSGGSLPPPEGYFARVREICDRHGVLLVSDEVICAFGRLGEWFGAERYSSAPDMITFAKGVTSGYSPLGGVAISDRIAEPFDHGKTSFAHGFTFGGHPVSCAVALASIEVFDRENVLGHVRAQEPVLHERLNPCSICRWSATPGVPDSSGPSNSWAPAAGGSMPPNASCCCADSSRRRCSRPASSHARTTGDAIIQLAPPLICDDSHFDEMTSILRSVLTEAHSVLEGELQ